MKNENDLMDSLLREHARSKGVDEKFLKDLDDKLDAEDRGNVIPLDRSSNSSSGRGISLGLGLGIGVAACAAFYMTGTMMWKNSSSSEVIALEGEAAAEQIESAKEGLMTYGTNESRSPQDPSTPAKTLEDATAGMRAMEGAEADVAADKAKDSKQLAEANTLMKAEASGSKEEKRDYQARERSDKKPNMQNEVAKAPSAVLAREMTKSRSASPERLLEFGDGNNFGPGWGGKSGSGAGIGGGGMSLDRDALVKQKKVLEYNAEQYGKLIENAFTAPIDKETKRSTFAIDVDTASYANVRRLITNGERVPADSVRIEEMVNYFDYQYKKPVQDAKHPFAVYVDAAACPWNKDNKLVRIALQGKDIIREDRPASNVVFLLDVSGSMNRANKLPLLKDSLKYLLEEMNEKDTISIVVYAGASGLVLPATKMDDAGRMKVIQSMTKLSAGGSTAGGAGIKLAYKVAQENFIKGGVNRVILATDGDFNVGVSDPDQLTEIVKGRAKEGVDISVLGFGTGNLNDNMLELITNNGNGNYSYIDTIKEGRKVLLEDMMGTMVTIAKDVKIQVEFNPERVKEYRLVGYSNRMLPNAAFLDKKADAGEIGAGHRVTAFYEVVPGKALDKSKLDGLRYGKKKPKETNEDELLAPQHADELLFVKLAYKNPEQKINDESTYLSVALKDQVKDLHQVDDDFMFASSVALFGMVIRDSDHRGDGNLDLVQRLAEAGKGADGKGLREEFIKLVKKVKETEIRHRNREQ